jgi:predicted transcriptional regulator
MADEDTNYKITEQTDIEILEGELTDPERRWLESSRILEIKSHHTNTKEVTQANLNVDRLAQLAFEYEILKDIASSVETDIMDVFRRTSDNMLTTSQLADATGRPKSSISRALSRLVEKGKLHRVQAGVYKHA